MFACACLEGTSLVEIGGKYFCEYIDSVAPSCSPISCPDGYAYNSEADICISQYTTNNLCPKGSIYDSIEKTCTETIEYEANCTCQADVSASPQTICSGETTAINLTSTYPGVVYVWIVSQTGVTGASSGGGSSISQQLFTTTGGTATYTITPYEGESCAGPSTQVVVTVNAKPNIIATPGTPQSILSGGVVNTALSSGVSGTTFAWTVTAPSTITGATAGSGTTISNTLVLEEEQEAVVVTYHITATSLNGCTNTLEYEVNVGATVAACLATLTAKVLYDSQAHQYKNNTTIASITITGTTGNATIELNSIIVPVVYNTSPTQTATDFVTINNAAFSGVTITNYGPTITFTKSTASIDTPVIRNADGDLNGTLSVTGGIINELWSLASTSDHVCNRARFEFMTNGVSVGIVNLNNAPNGTPGQIRPQQENIFNVIPNPTIGQPGYPDTYPSDSRLSTVIYNPTEIANIASGLSPEVTTLKIRLRGTNIVTGESLGTGFPEPYYYDQHNSAVGIEFFVGDVSVYKGRIGKKVLVVDPCQPTLTPRILEASTGGTSTISDITWGTGTGILTAGTPIVENTVTQNASVIVTTLGTYDFIAYNNGITFRVVNTFTTLGVQTVTLTALGTPIVAGTLNFQPDLTINYSPEVDRIPPSFTRTIT